jgi:hypothetical protein
MNVNANEHAVGVLDRLEMKRQIAEHERKAFELRQSLPPAVKTFYRFRMVAPARSFVFIYAGDEGEARSKLEARLVREYGSYRLHGVADVWDAGTASVNCGVGSSLLDCLTEDDACEFLADWHEDTQGKPASRRQSQLERDIAAYEFRKRREAAAR